MLGFISQIADITGIASFVLSIVLLIRSESLRKSIIYQRIDYNKKRSNTRSKMMAFNEALSEDDSISFTQISEIRQELYQCLLSFQHIFSFKDRWTIRKIITLLNAPLTQSNRIKISKLLDYIIARFGKKEDS